MTGAYTNSMGSQLALFEKNGREAEGNSEGMVSPGLDFLGIKCFSSYFTLAYFVA